MTILFASPDWKEFKAPLQKAFLKFGIKHNLVNYENDYEQEAVEFIIFSPDSILTDFSVFKNLRSVLSLWAGVDGILENKSLKKPLIRLIDPGMKQRMIEWCLTHVLRHHLSIDKYVNRDNKKWHLDIKPPLAQDRRVGILGLGELGNAVGNALVNIGFNVSGWSTSPKPNRMYNQHFGSDGFKEILSSSEILILLLPLTTETEFIINENSLSFVRDEAIILNAGRGKLINDSHLINALRNGKISHATLDVFVQEPLPLNHPYWSHKNVTVSPHIAATTQPDTAANTIASNIKRILGGEKPIGLVDAQKLY